MAETIREAYIRKNPGSAELYPRFKDVFPGGGGGHDMRVAEPFPICIARGQGTRLWDVDGNEYIDFGLGSASLLLGHSHPAVVEALVQAAPRGSQFSHPHEAELEWGERVCNLVPCADKVRFVGSGAEATMLSMRVARAYTGKEKIVRWESHYHGWHDYAMPGSLPPFDVPASTGVPRGVMDSVIVLPPDLDALERTLANDNNIAGVITEGSGASYGTVPLKSGFLEGVRKLTRQYNVVMILDEVITGFRWSPGGLQQKIGLDPDLCTMAKILTGGLPGGAVAGSDEIMRVIAQTGDSHHDRFQRVSHGGTFNANSYAAATGNAALKIVATGEMQETADRMAERLRVGLREIVDRYEVAACVYGDSSTFHVYFGARSIEGFDAGTLKDQPLDIQNAFRQALQVRGVDLMSRTSGVLSGVHTEADIDRSLEAFDGAFKAMVDEGLVSHS
ncbi:MAG: aminotransferase class III-fold pyridoxal phosphate-dependent enzyme [Dehalococcoidia bacterium]|nr:aminotransferase class III-fold pyridoxal phosphate-dependent enzyme [Dehalococcoidia bacterium]